MSRRFTTLTSTPLQSLKIMDVFTTPSYFKQKLDTKRFFLAKLLGVDEAKIFIAETDSSIAFQALLTSLVGDGFIATYGGAKSFEDYPPLCVVGLLYYLDKTLHKDFAMRSWGFTYPFEKKDKAFAKCLGEALERHAFYYVPGSTVHRYPTFEKKDASELFKLCATLKPGTTVAQSSGDLKNTPCIRVKSLTDGLFDYLPYRCLYWCPITNDDKVVREPNTNGGGGGTTKEMALLSGLYEYIERDHFLLYWLSGKHPQIIKHEDIPGEFGDYLRKVKRDYHIDVYFLYVSYDIQAQTVVAVAVDPILSVIGVGAKASQGVEFSMKGALLEAIAILSFVRERGALFSEEKLTFYLDATKRMKIGQEERMNMYCSKKGIDIITKHFLSGEYIDFSVVKKKDTVFTDEKEELAFLQKEFVRLVQEKGEGYHVYYQDAKTIWTKKENYHVIKTYVPSFLCLYLNEVYKPVFSERLEAFKKERGIPAEYECNLPHFLG